MGREEGKNQHETVRVKTLNLRFNSGSFSWTKRRQLNHIALTVAIITLASVLQLGRFLAGVKRSC